MSRSFLIIILVLCSGLIFFIVKKIVTGNESSQSALQKKGGGAVMSEIMIVRDSLITYQLHATGTVRANEEVSIVSEYAGKITGIYFKEGTTIEKGGLLFRLDDAELKARKKKLEAGATLATQNEQRLNVLLSKGGASQQDYDEAANNLQAIQADLELINVQLSKTEIRAPFTGKAGLRTVSEGAYVSANTPLTSLQDVSRIKVDFTLPEKYAAIIQSGQHINFSVENDTQSFSATILATEPAVNPSTRSILVRAVSDNAQRRLIPGTSSTITIALHETRKSVMVPTSALIPQSTGFTGYLLKGGKAVAVPLKTGYRDENNVQVTEGLVAGDTLLTTNMLMLRPGVTVKPVSKPTE
ncbi:MAG: efflux RND transporter periplasmic adaptor subunit [Chitinophagales bacterium]|nr:efflux RND transporter periplasmic adaptor subunit [Chitinophagales bacterium]